MTLSEADVEQIALEWLDGLGWRVAHGPDIAPGTPNAERSDYRQVALERRLRDSLLPRLVPGEVRMGPTVARSWGIDSAVLG